MNGFCHFSDRNRIDSVVQAFQRLGPDSLTLCRLSSSAKDTLTLADAKAGVLITGQTGRGKTSGPGRLLARAYLRAGFGGLVLCAKIDEADLWRKYLRETGREADGIFFGEDSSKSLTIW